MGVWSNVRVDIDYVNETLMEVLICSDGLYGYINPSLIEDVMLSFELTTALKARRLLNYALKAGGYDNITIIIIELKVGDNK